MTERQREFSDLLIQHSDVAEAVIDLIQLMKGTQLAPKDPAIIEFIENHG